MAVDVFGSLRTKPRNRRRIRGVDNIRTQAIHDENQDQPILRNCDELTPAKHSSGHKQTGERPDHQFYAETVRALFTASVSDFRTWKTVSRRVISRSFSTRWVGLSTITWPPLFRTEVQIVTSW